MRIGLSLPVVVLSLSIACLASGCVRSKKAKLRERDAFIAGQQQAMALMRQQGQGTQVPPQMQQPQQIQVDGAVDNSILPWTEGLTLAQAIVAANYRAFRDPQEVIIVRNGQAISINPKALLAGEDEPLQPGDRIILR